VIKVCGYLGIQRFSPENGLKCSKKVGIFPEMGVSPKKRPYLFIPGS